jgi:FMN phosphatase YigB (HAD superfamily)
MTKIKAVVFDQGETLINETRFWSSVAAYAGVSDFTLFGVLGGLIERRENHRSVFSIMQIESVDPGIIGYQVEQRDLYPDVIRTLTRLKHDGYILATAGNQSASVEGEMADLDLPVVLNATSAGWGLSKPDPAFFLRIAEELDLQPNEILYIGDRLDNDYFPAQSVGMHAVFIRRGPWGNLHSTWSEIADVKHQITDLSQIPQLIADMERAS